MARCFGFFEAPEPPFLDSWEAFWATANDLAIPIHFHLSGGMHSISFSGIFERCPRVRLVLGNVFGHLVGL